MSSFLNLLLILISKKLKICLPAAGVNKKRVAAGQLFLQLNNLRS
jgi:hypothetical protein